MTSVVAERDSTELRFRAMGSDVHVMVVGGPPELGAAARARIDELESRWSRFRPDSELSRLNRLAAGPCSCRPTRCTAVRRGGRGLAVHRRAIRSDGAPRTRQRRLRP